MFKKKLLTLCLCIAAMTAVHAQYDQYTNGMPNYAHHEVLEALASSSRDTVHIFRLLAMARFYTNNISQKRTLFDSAMICAARARKQSEPGYVDGITMSYIEELHAWLKLADEKRFHKEPCEEEDRKAKESEKKLVDYMTRENELGDIGTAYMNLASFHNQLRTFGGREVFRLDSLAIVYFRAAGDKVDEANALFMTGMAYLGINDDAHAEEFLQESVRVGTEGNWPQIYRAYAYLGNMYVHQDKHKRGLEYLLKAVRQADAANDKSPIAAVTNLFLAQAYSVENDSAKALTYYQKSLELFEGSAETNLNDLGFGASNLARRILEKTPNEAIDLMNKYLAKYPGLRDTYSYRNFLAGFVEAYGKLKQYDKGRKYCDELIRLNEHQPNMVYIYTTIQFLVRSRDYATAQKFLDVYGKNALASQQKPHIYRYHLYQSFVDSARHNYKAALDNFIKAKIASDSIYNNRKASELNALTVEYETEKKEQAIELLTKEGELREQKNRQISYATFGGIGVLVIIVGLLYNQYRNKQRANEVITSKNERLQDLVDEKQWLLKEVHHRVKNNLQTVVSLLESQSSYLRGSEAVTALQDSQNRVKAMSLIHQKLYQTENVSSLDMNRYLRELISYLADSFNVRQKIYFDVDIESVELDVSQAIPIGLLLNEAITNSIKHGFRGRENGNVITVRMKHEDDDRVNLIVSDNGTGFPPDLDIEQVDHGLGLGLMKGLMTDIDGQLTIRSEGGVTVSVSFVASELLSKAVHARA